MQIRKKRHRNLAYSSACISNSPFSLLIKPNLCSHALEYFFSCLSGSFVSFGSKQHVPEAQSQIWLSYLNA